MERSASDVWLRLGRGKASYLTLPYLTSYCWNLELVVLDVSLSPSLSLIIRPTTPLKVQEGTIAPSIYTVVPYLTDSVVQKTGYYFFLSFLVPFQIEPEYTESVVTNKTNQPTNQ